MSAFDFIGHTNTPRIICPHCFQEMTDDDMHDALILGSTDLWSLAPNEERAELACPNIDCEQAFFVQGGYRPEYTTAKTEDEL